MATYYETITCQFGGSVPFQAVTAVQGDTKSRVVRVSLIMDNQPYAIPTGTAPRVRFKKPDGTVVFNDCTVSGGAVIVELTAQMLAVSGRAACSVTLFGIDASELTTVRFHVDIQPAVIQDGDIESADEFKALAEALSKVDTAAETAEHALDMANRALQNVAEVENARDAANTAADRANAAADGITNTYAPAIPASASGAVAALTDVAATGTLTRAAILGATAQAGTPSPTAPVPVTGVTPATLMTVGANLFDFNPSLDLYQIAEADYAAGYMKSVTFTAVSVVFGTGRPWNVNTAARVPLRAGVTYTLSMQYKSSIASNLSYIGLSGWTDSGESQVLKVVVGVPTTTAYQSGSWTFTPTEDLKNVVLLAQTAGQTGLYYELDNVGLYAGSPPASYEPCALNEYPLPALAELYGDGTVNDAYDAVSGAETRAWNRIAFNGTETWIREGAQTSGKYLFRVTGIPLPMKPSSNDTPGQVRSSHYVTDTANNQWRTNESVAISVYSYLYIYDSSHNTTVDDFKAWLAAQAAAGTPVTVVYRLATPTTTQNGGTAIAPPHPNAMVYADNGNVDVGYGKDTKAYIDRAIAAAIAGQGGTT